MALEALQCQSNLTLCDYFAIIGFDKKKGLQVFFIYSFNLNRNNFLNYI